MRFPLSRMVADLCPLSGVKQTSQLDGAAAANDPKRTLLELWPNPSNIVARKTR